MGCGESKEKLPTLLCFFETGNEEQKNYCIKLKDNFKHEKPIRFEIKSSPGVNFSIKFKIKEKVYNIESVFNDSEVQMNNSLNIMYKYLDGANYLI